MVNESAPKPHVAFLSSPGMGHITPLYELAIRLVTEHNFQVSFLVIPAGSTPAQDKYLNSNQLPDLHIVDLPSADMSDFHLDDMSVVIRLCCIVEEHIRPLRSVLTGTKRPKPKAFVIDMFCTGVFEACNDLNIPVYSFFTASAAFLTFSLYLPKLDCKAEGEFVLRPEPVKVPGCNPILTKDLLDLVPNGMIDDYKLWFLHVSRLSMVKGIFVNTWDDLEPVSLKAMKHERFFLDIPTPPVYPIGPLTKQAEPLVSEYEKEAIEWLDKQPNGSVLLVALGSGGTLTSEQLIELAWGLELSQQRFILVVRKPSDCALSAFFSAGSDPDDPEAYLPEGFVERTKGVGLVVSSWAPQVAVLSHPSTGAFLSHCGWNSTMESVNYGVPVIAWPLYVEQRMNATMLCNEVGVAEKMPVVGEGGETVVVGRKEIESVVKAVLEGEEGKKLRSRAKELEAKGRETLSRVGSSYEALARVIESWKIET
ncbi:anthocyanidin 3-O-glucosyltransferase 5-like [Bidens hawaiensis]|uniref:anthocyanidin 3-O-glucosyltransferase 5-like n=1 Tax=Bidens hawaiensis TaxID=980011 RepID=UPI00404B45EA